MKTRIILIATIFSYLTISAQTIKTEKVDKTKLPEGISYKGKVKEAIRFTDSSGNYLVFITETGEYRDPKNEYDNEESMDAELYAYCFAIKGDMYERVWRVFDFIHDCPVDIEASFVQNTFQITDLNKDGIAEIWLMYRTACHGDVSPCDMKIIMYQEKQKFAMRGQDKDPTGYGGDYKFDNAFANGPKEFLLFAKKMWSKQIEREVTE